MRTLGLLIGCMCISAASAFAFSGQLSVGACPGDPAVGAPILECASGESFTVIGVFEPGHDFTDLIGLDFQMVLTLPGSTLADSPFWNFDEYASPCAYLPGTTITTLSVNRLRPARGCGDYRQMWDQTGSVSGYGASRSSLNAVRVGTLCYRATDAAATQGERLFGFAVPARKRSWGQLKSLYR